MWAQTLAVLVCCRPKGHLHSGLKGAAYNLQWTGGASFCPLSQSSPFIAVVVRGKAMPDTERMRVIRPRRAFPQLVHELAWPLLQKQCLNRPRRERLIFSGCQPGLPRRTRPSLRDPPSASLSAALFRDLFAAPTSSLLRILRS